MPQLRNIPTNYILELTAAEYRLVTMGLAMMAGLPVRPHDKVDVAAAESLNRHLLQLRERSLRGELQSVQGALAVAESISSPELTVTAQKGIVGQDRIAEKHENPDSGRTGANLADSGGGGRTVVCT
jgi:hypothetical protein